MTATMTGMKLPRTLAAWGRADFPAIFKAELEAQDGRLLPLQQGLSQSSYAITEGFTAIIQGVVEQPEALLARVGIAYRGIIPGCSCADDPTPMNELSEYCELEISINRQSAQAEARLL